MAKETTIKSAELMKTRTINHIIYVEGGHVDDPNDSGGETNFGITIAVARAFGYVGTMRDLPRQTAFDIYTAKYWDSVRAEGLAALSERVAEEVVDTGVNCGPSRAGRFLQRALNVFNKRAKLYPDLKVDGNIGPATIKALRGYLATRDEDTLVKALNCLQGAFYITLSERREKDERFIYGWFKNRVKI